MTKSSGKLKGQDKRRNNGGARAGAGRPRSTARLAREKQFEELAIQEVLIPVRSNGQVRYKKVSVLKALLDTLVEKAIRDQDIRAARLYLDVTIGKPVRYKSATRYREDTRKYVLLRKLPESKYAKVILEAYHKNLVKASQANP